MTNLVLLLGNECFIGFFQKGQISFKEVFTMQLELNALSCPSPYRCHTTNKLIEASYMWSYILNNILVSNKMTFIEFYVVNVHYL